MPTLYQCVPPKRPKNKFRTIFISLIAIFIFMIIGIIGFRYIVGVSWLDGFYRSATIITNLDAGPQPTTVSGKLFIAIYALVAIIGIFTILLTILISR